MRPRRGGALLATALSWLVAGLAGAEPGPAVLASVGELFRDPLHEYAIISPDGDRVAVVRHERRGRKLLVHHVDSSRRTEVEDCTIERVEWLADHLLLVGHQPSPGGGGKRSRDEDCLLEFRTGEDPLAHRRLELRSPGTIISSLPRSQGEVLFVPDATSRSVYRIDPRRLTMRSREWKALTRGDGDAPPELQPVARLAEHVLSWIADAEGQVRAATSLDGDPLEWKIWHRDSAEAPWRVVHRESDREKFEDLAPFAFTADGSRLLVASAVNRDRYGLYEYLPGEDRIDRLVYEHPTAELIDVVTDYTSGEVLGAFYVDEGERRFASFGLEDDALQRAIEGAFTDRSVGITGLSRDRRRASVVASRSDDPGAFWVVDLDSGGASELGRIRPWLDNNLLASSRAFEVESADGMRVEGFLTLPPMEVEAPPLVVMPHGGPIGIADVRAFSAEIQYLARMGYAILRVNYRGSGGRGRRFEKAGNRQWGRGIEDDIEAAIDHVVEQGWVDGDRICTTGASYGGYSALMLVVRRPDRYRCAASLMGVTDIALLFNADEVWGGSFVTDKMREIVGDPEAHYAEQQRYSPVYNADRIRVPVLLAHGSWDQRVDFDHMVRMKLALELEGNPPSIIELRQAGHRFNSRRDAIKYFVALREFLDRHLDPR